MKNVSFKIILNCKFYTNGFILNYYYFINLIHFTLHITQINVRSAIIIYAELGSHRKINNFGRRCVTKIIFIWYAK